MKRVFLTGDTHSDFGKLWRLHKEEKTTKEDIVIILGDSGINYMSGGIARITKENLSRLPLTVACLHGNHEQRVENISTYMQQRWHNGQVFTEEAYPSLIFMKDGETYTINGNTYFVVGGAYSPDKQYRIEHKYPWFADEQPSEATKHKINETLINESYSVDYVLTHTCPYSDVPFHMLSANHCYGDIDYSTERWLDEIKKKIQYKHWYCGHYHISINEPKFSILYNDIVEII